MEHAEVEAAAAARAALEEHFGESAGDPLQHAVEAEHVAVGRLVLLIHEARPDFAWTAVTYAHKRYVWFALKDPGVLRSTMLWMSNGGRHYSPWNGRHVRVLGIEDVTAYFHYGAAESARANAITRQGFATSIELRPNHPFTVNYIMAVAEIPEGFRKVRAIIPGKHHVTLVSTDNHRVSAAIDTTFLYNQS